VIRSALARVSDSNNGGKRMISSTPIPNPDKRLNIAIVGSGVAGMSAAWLLSKQHQVTLYEKDDRMGGHSNTVEVEVDVNASAQPVDTGFIVYNERNYPNLVALFEHLGVQTRATDMSFAASLEAGRFEYSGSGLRGLFAQPKNILRPRMWSMLRELRRFYREAPTTLATPGSAELTLGDYLKQQGYGEAFVQDHLLPMGAAIWSTPAQDMLQYPLTAFVRFCQNHGLLSLAERPTWRTVVGGSREYMRKLTAAYSDRVRLNTAVRAIRRLPDRVLIEDRQGGIDSFDHVVMAAHADQSLHLLADADPAERKLLSKFRYERNLALLHSDPALMPHNKRAWASWNFLSHGRGEEQKVSVTYWMNRLQHISDDSPLFVTLNPLQQPQAGRILRSFMYEHPLFDQEAIAAQRLLWNLQGVRRTWFCGAYFGHGFHEDGLQAGLAVAEQLGGLRRPWRLDQPNSRIHCNPLATHAAAKEQAA
jgi:predicted NAD/FAD-binding protein